MKAKKVITELTCIISIAAGFVVICSDNATSAITIVADPFPDKGDLAVFSSEITVNPPIFVGREIVIDTDVHNLGITCATTWHDGDYVEYDFNQSNDAILDIKMRVRSTSSPTVTDVHLDGTKIADFNSMPAFDIVTIHNITVLSGDHTIKATQMSDSPSQGDNLVIDWITIGNHLIEGELYNRSYGNDPNPSFRGVDSIAPSLIETRFYIDDILLAENKGVGSHSNLVPGDSPYPKVDFIPNNGTTNTSTTWTPSIPGYHTISIEVLSVDNWDSNLTNNKANITVYVGVPPPKLYINTSQDGRDAVINWNPPKVPWIDHYLIYRSKSQTDFDFCTIWKNTSIDMEQGESASIPLRTMWNDTNAANPNNITNFNVEYYYTIRAVNIYGQLSSTSRTVGKWTKTFSEGVSTFSIPLEPFWNLTAVDYLADMGAVYLKWMDPTNHTWLKHGDGGLNDTRMEVGEGYEVKFANKTNYTFTGMPSAMICSDGGTGFPGFDFNSEAKNLTATVDSDGNITLTWQEPASMGIGDWYEVYYSNTRDGFFETLGIDYYPASPSIGFGTDTTVHIVANANDPGTRFYYMVVPFNSSGYIGSSTYSIGIWTEEYLEGYDTIGIPLILNYSHFADWYCNSIAYSVGINYYNISYQEWYWHSTRMPQGAYDPMLEMTEGYQISTSGATKFTFIGV